MANLSVVFDLIAKDRASKELRNVGDAADKTGGKLGTIGKVAAGAAAGGVAVLGTALVSTFRGGLAELQGNQTAIAQFTAGIKSTGGAANVSAKEMQALADSIERKTGTDGAAVVSGGALLATFTKVRNEAGKGNDVFNRATQAGVDLAARGFGSVQSNAVLLGKALNDPIKGLTALGRQGVTFTAAQRKTIEALVATGDTLGAQRIILAEVEGQVGGSAEAYGQTLPGQLARARAALEGVQETVVRALLPALISGLDFVTGRLIPGFSSFADRVGPIFARAREAVDSFMAGLRGNGPVAGFTGALNTLGLGLRALVEAFRYGDVTSNGFVGAMETVGDALFRLRPKVEEVARFIRDSLVPAIVVAAKQAGELIAQFIGLVKNTPTPVLQVAAAAVGALVAVFGTAVAINRTAAAATAAYTAVKGIFITTTNAQTGAVTLSTVAQLRNTVATAAGTVATVATTAANAAARVAMAAFTAAKVVGTAATVAMTAATTALGVAVRFALGPIGLAITAIGLLSTGVVIAYKRSDTFRAIVDRLWQALKTAGSWVVDTGRKVGTWITDKFNAAGDKLGDFIDAMRSFRLPGWVKRLGDIVGGIGGGFKSAFNRLRDGIGDGPGRAGAVGGSTLKRVQALLPSGAYITSTYRSPAQNARVGGSPTSFHTDARNPAVDIGGSTAVLDRLYRQIAARGPWRELLWRVPGHFDHIHVAHAGGTVDPSWATLPGLRRDERPVVTQVGETILAAGDSGRLVVLLEELVQENRALRAEVSRLPQRHQLNIRTA